jgi:hypothetical protein
MSRLINPSIFLFLRGFPSLNRGKLEFSVKKIVDVPHRRRVVATDVHSAASVACRSQFVALDL